MEHTLSQPRTSHSFRLSPEAYASLEAKCAQPFVGKDTTELQAGYLLGVQTVLKMLRDGFTISA